MRKILISVTVSIIILLGTLFMGQTLPYAKDPLRTEHIGEFSKGWLLTIEGSPLGKIIDLPYDVHENEANQKITIQKRLPLENFSNPTLRIGASYLKFRVFLEDELIYQFDSLESINHGKAVGNACFIVDLPQDCFGKEVKIEFESPGKQTVDVLYKIEFGTRDYNVLVLYSLSSVEMMIAFSLLLLALLISTLVVLVNLKYKIGYQDIYLVGLILCVVIWIIGQSQGYLFIYNNFAFNYYIQLNILFVSPILMYRYIYHRYNMEYKQIILWLADIHLGCWALILIMQLFDMIDLNTVQRGYTLFFCITLFTCMGVVIKEVNKNRKYLIGILGVFILIILINIFKKDVDSIRISMNTMVLAIIFLEGVIIVKIINSLVKLLETKNDNRVLKVQLDAQLQHYLLLEQKYTSYKKLQHDTKNHWKVVNQLACENKIGEVQHYTSLMVEEIEEQKQKVVDTGNYILDAILTEKFYIANSLGIKVTHEIFIKKNIAIDLLDWCSIYGNALDNAIEACKKVDDLRWINIKIYYKEGQLICKISNAINTSLPIDMNYKTTKENKEIHGFGLKNIKKSVEKYGGELQISHTREVFEIAFVLFEV
ncbi:ATP-binding protein [Niameybacter massiliensis]|uniref:ATP-binding protein n=1 Tax=Niameybacter massiliensis TaxID=1658108 RepID=UPI0006B5CC44|nr:ATP-binding protein [Niameybacter massiliensis]